MDENNVSFGTGGEPNAWWRRLTQRTVVIPVLALLFVGAGFWVFSVVGRNVNNGVGANQKSLETNLEASKAASSYDNIVDNTSDLIEGDKKGEYELDNKQLANVYMDRMTANMNLGKYEEVVEDAKKLKSLSSEHLIGALQAEAESRYKLGQREEVIPVYKQLIDEMRKSDWPTRNSYIQQYQEYLSMLQSGQELPLQ
jgi:tetratricopeptide (TPR) repeat protein